MPSLVGSEMCIRDREVSDGQFWNNHYNRTGGGYDVNGFGAAFRFTPNDNWTVDFSLRANYQDDEDEGVQCRTYPSTSMYNAMVAQHGAAALANFSGNATGGIGMWGGTSKLADGTVHATVGHIDRMYKGATLDFWNECRQQNLDGPHVTSQEKDTALLLDNEFVNITTEWDSAGAIAGFDNLNFKMITAKQLTDLKYWSDRDGSSLSIDALGGTGLRGARREVGTVELLLTADVNEQLSFIAGYHYFDDEVQAGARSQNGCLAKLERKFHLYSCLLYTSPSPRD